ncbi:MAG: hypothetical protein ACLFTT_00250 [Candidatus Hydrogenedentota bacterium]
MALTELGTADGDAVLEGVALHFDAPAEVRLIRMAIRPGASEFRERAVGRRLYQIGKTDRPVLFAHCPTAITYTLTPPPRARFHTGFGMRALGYLE